MTTRGWAIKYRSGCIGIRVCHTRRQAIEAEVESWWPQAMNDWHDKPVSWRWRWLKRHWFLRAVRVEIVEVME